MAEGWETDLRCDGNEVAVGACSSGMYKDCPGEIVKNRLKIKTFEAICPVSLFKKPGCHNLICFAFDVSSVLNSSVSLAFQNLKCYYICLLRDSNKV